MVSKLQLAIAENIKNFESQGVSKDHLKTLYKHYEDIRFGIGVQKSPEEYGAIPTDPYSHTPAMMGAQQPGMTGQVKEDIIARWFELGIDLKNGTIHFNPDRLNKEEFNAKGELSFTFCQVPICYKMGTNTGISFLEIDSELNFDTYSLDNECSRKIFNRSEDIKQIVIHIPK